jgi:hypothetical protein
MKIKITTSLIFILKNPVNPVYLFLSLFSLNSHNKTRAVAAPDVSIRLS